MISGANDRRPMEIHFSPIVILPSSSLFVLFPFHRSSCGESSTLEVIDSRGSSRGPSRRAINVISFNGYEPTKKARNFYDCEQPTVRKLSWSILDNQSSRTVVANEIDTPSINYDRISSWFFVDASDDVRFLWLGAMMSRSWFDIFLISIRYWLWQLIIECLI